MFAFGVRHANTRMPLHDPNLVEFAAYIDILGHGTESEHIPLEFHKCSSEEYAKFGPVKPS